MTFTLMLILNIVLDLGILATLAFVLTRPAKLRPHGVHAHLSSARRERVAGETARTPVERAGSRMRPLLD
jgi:hypothetical protein